MICGIGIEFQEYEKKFDMKLNPKKGKWQEVDSGNFSISYSFSLNPIYPKLYVTKVYNDTDIHQEMQYDTLGRIKSVVFTYDRVNVGTSYLFDTLGNITKTIDERQADKYPICFREALEIVKRKIPKRHKINVIERDSMMMEEKKVYYWSISTQNPKKSYYYHYSINAKTGKVINEGISRVVCDSPG